VPALAVAVAADLVVAELGVLAVVELRWSSWSRCRHARGGRGRRARGSAVVVVLEVAVPSSPRWRWGWSSWSRCGAGADVVAELVCSR
jgi:hypothetical protein